MLISYMTQMMMMFSVIIVVGLFLTWINDRLEHVLARFIRRSPTKVAQRQPTRVVPSLQSRQLALSPLIKQATVRTISIPKLSKPGMALSEVAGSKPHDYAGKIVKIDLAPRSRASQDESGEKLGEHVKVHLPKAA
jgi:hypothetical protein